METTPPEPAGEAGARPAGSTRGGAQFIPRPSTWRPGGPAPWASLPSAERRVQPDRLRRALAEAGPPLRSTRERAGTRASAVLAPLYEERGALHVVLTRRAQHLRSHRGEVSFPGGGQEGDETPLATALREAQEETGMDPDAVEVIGELDHLETVMSNSYIVPFVGWLPGRPELVADPGEVAKILHVPLGDLLDPDAFREERWGLPGMERPLYFFEIADDTIWGATAAMLRNLLAIATGTPWR